MAFGYTCTKHETNFTYHKVYFCKCRLNSLYIVCLKLPLAGENIERVVYGSEEAVRVATVIVTVSMISSKTNTQEFISVFTHPVFILRTRLNNRAK